MYYPEGQIMWIWRPLQKWNPYLGVTVREDQLVIDCDRFPLCQCFNQQLLFDLGNQPQDLKMTTNMQTNMESHGSESRCYLQQFWEPGQDLWWPHFQTFLTTIWFSLVGHVAQIQNGRKNRKDPATWSPNSVNWQQQRISASMRFDKGIMINVLHHKTLLNTLTASLTVSLWRRGSQPSPSPVVVVQNHGTGLLHLLS